MKQIIRLIIAVTFAIGGLQTQSLGAENKTEVTDRPTIFWMPQGTYNNHFITGSGFKPGKTRVWIQEAPVLRLMKDKDRQKSEKKLLAALNKPLPVMPLRPPIKDVNGKPIPHGAWQPLTDNWRIAVVSPWTCRPDALAFEHTTMWGSYGQKMPRIYWVETSAGFSQPFLGGGIDPWFAFPNTTQPGKWIRVVGRAMDVYTRSTRLVALKEKITGKVIPVDWGLMILTNNDAGENTYHTYVKIPENCSPGTYDLYLHKGGGGVYGWSDPVSLTVLPKAEQNAPKVQVLAVPNAQRAHTAEWINARLTEIAKQGGGVALLPAGQYTLEETIVVPSRVTLRGVSQGGVELITTDEAPGILLHSETKLANLTVKHSSILSPAIQVGQNGEIVKNVGLNRCRLITKPGPVNDLKRYCGIVVASPSRNLSIKDCILEGRYLVGLFGNADYAHIAYCKAGLQVEAGLKNSIVEFNECRNTPSTYFIRLHDDDVHHNLFAWNKLVELIPIDLPMGIVFDGTQAGGNAQVVQAQSTTLTVQNNTYNNNPAGKWLVVISGRARGTIRKIITGSTDEIRLSSPLTNLPEAGDQLYLGPLIRQNLVATNMDIRHQGGVEFLGACVENTVFSHISEETKGVAFLGIQRPNGPAAPCYFNMAHQLDVYYGGTVGVGAIRHQCQDSSILAYGNFLYKVTVNDSHWLSESLSNTAPQSPNEQLRWGGIWFMDRTISATKNLSSLAANGIMESRSSSSASGAGFYIGTGVNGTILKNIIATGNQESLRDRGHVTARK